MKRADRIAREVFPRVWGQSRQIKNVADALAFMALRGETPGRSEILVAAAAEIRALRRQVRELRK